jgi:flagellar hook-associated protein 3 FlgL
MRKISDRIHELSITAANGTYSAEDKVMIATEVAQYKEQLLAYSNSKDENDNYFFSGTKNSTQAFLMAPDGSVTYQGDQTAIFVEIGSGEKIRVNTIGSELLGNVSRTADDGSISKVSAFTMIDVITLQISQGLWQMQSHSLTALVKNKLSLVFRRTAWLIG